MDLCISQLIAVYINLLLIFPLLIVKDVVSQIDLRCSNVVRGSVHDAIHKKK